MNNHDKNTIIKKREEIKAWQTMLFAYFGVYY